MNTRPSHLLDPALFDFAGLSLGNVKLTENSPESEREN
jgi:tRNA 2-thiocytidine biosynthesis protein TtcA